MLCLYQEREARVTAYPNENAIYNKQPSLLRVMAAIFVRSYKSDGLGKRHKKYEIKNIDLE